MNYSNLVMSRRDECWEIAVEIILMMVTAPVTVLPQSEVDSVSSHEPLSQHSSEKREQEFFFYSVRETRREKCSFHVLFSETYAA